MKQFILKNLTALTGFATAIVLGILLMSFQDSPFVYDKYDLQPQYGDTLPDKDQNDHMKMQDFDHLMSDLDTKILLQVGDALKNVDFEKIEKDVENAMKSIDMEKIMKDVDQSVKSIDLDKILADVKFSMKDIDWDKHSSEINDALKEARQELEKAKIEIKDIDMKEISKEIEKAKLEIEKVNQSSRRSTWIRS